MIGMIIVVTAFCLVVAVLLMGFILDLLGYYNHKQKKEEKPYMDNSEYEYGHNVNHKNEIIGKQELKQRER